MPTSRSASTVLVPVVEEVPLISAQDSADLLASLEQGRADIAAGRYDVLTPGKLRAEFDAIATEDMTDDELDQRLGIAAT